MNVLFSKYSYHRKRKYRVKTDIIREGKEVYVQKKAIGIEAWRLLLASGFFYNNYSKKLPDNIKLSRIIKKNEENQSMYFEFIEGKTIEAKIEQYLIEKRYVKAKLLFEEAFGLIASFKEKPTKSTINLFNRLITNFKGEIPQKIYNFFVPLTDLSFHNFIIKPNSIYRLIDYECFFGIPIPLRYVQFRAEFDLLQTLQQVLKALASKEFTLVSYLSGIYIPEEWIKINNFSLKEKRLYLFLEEKLQTRINKSNIRYIPKTSYKLETVKNRDCDRLTVSQYLYYQNSVIRMNRIEKELQDVYSSKVWKLGLLARKVKEILLKNIMFRKEEKKLLNGRLMKRL